MSMRVVVQQINHDPCPRTEKQTSHVSYVSALVSFTFDLTQIHYVLQSNHDGCKVRLLFLDSSRRVVTG